MRIKNALRVGGGGDPAGAASFDADSAAASRRSVLAAFVSGWIFTKILNNSAAWFLSRVLVNWLIAGGTFKRCRSI